MSEHQAAIVEQRALAFRHRFQLADEIREFLDVPAANISQNAHSFRRLHRAVRVFVMPLRSMPKPRETRKSLALREHIRSNASLTRGQRMRQQIALQTGDSRPVLQIAAFRRTFDNLLVFRRQTRDGAFQFAHRSQILIHPLLVFGTQLRFERRRFSPDRIQNALLPIHPTLLRGRRTSGRKDDAESSPAAAAGPDPPSSDCAESLSPNDSWHTPTCSERNRESPPIAARDHLIDRRAAGAAAGVNLAGNKRAHRRIVAVPRTRQSGGRTIQTLSPHGYRCGTVRAGRDKA